MESGRMVAPQASSENLTSPSPITVTGALISYLWSLTGCRQ
jgi:hypothetical protein